MSDFSLLSNFLLFVLFLLLSCLVYVVHCINVRHRVHVFVSIGSLRQSPPLLLSLYVASTSIEFEVDTGAGASVMAKPHFQSLFPNVKLSKSRVILHSVNGIISTAGEVDLTVQFKGQHSQKLTIIVCDNTPHFMPLLGRGWLDILFPKWRSSLIPSNVPVNSVGSSVAQPPSVDSLKKLFPATFNADADSCILGFTAKLVLKPNVTPVFAKAYPVPFGIVDKVSNHLDKMATDGKMVHVRQSEWASPGLVVPKKDGSIRYCADFKKTLNPCLRVDHYPLPRPDDVFANISNGKVFTSLDLSDAYTQLLLDPESQELCVLNTHKGLYKLTRLIYGVSSAAAIFQSVMDRILQNIPNVVCYLDNILIVGSSMSECVEKTMLVLSRLEKHNVRLRQDKCEWFQSQIEYLGFIINSEGRKPNPSLVNAISDFPVPTNVSHVSKFLGMLNFYSEFLPEMSTYAKPLRLLTDDNFVWSTECQVSFDLLKQMLMSSNCIMHFDPSLPLILSVDASPVGVGAVLSHLVTHNNQQVERPVMFASATLTQTQQNYAQLDREALAVIFGITKFHKYLWGRQFTLVTDNSAIQRIFHQDKALPIRTGHRLQHWATMLQAYTYKIIHRKSECMSVPDALSRLPINVAINDISVHANFPELSLAVDLIAQETCKDPVLSRVCELTSIGWSNANSIKKNPDLSPFFKVRDSLSILKKCLMFGNRVVVPSALKSKVLNLLHHGHPGIVRSKLLARSVVWWPTLNSDLETLCTTCPQCAKVNFKPKKEYVPWPKSKYPFERVHVDFFYLSSQKVECLIFCEAFSRWLHVEPVTNISALNIIRVLFGIFTMWGTLPETLVSDNGPPFDSAEFLEFCTKFHITSKRIVPYHPESNCLGEKGVHIAKSGLKKLFPLKTTPDSPSESPEEVRHIINKFLFDYKNIPTTATNKSPNELLLSFKPRTLLSILNPAINPSSSLPLSKFNEGELVDVRFSKKHPIAQGRIVRIIGPNRYIVDFAGTQKIVHYNQMSLSKHM